MGSSLKGRVSGGGPQLLGAFPRRKVFEKNQGQEAFLNAGPLVPSGKASARGDAESDYVLTLRGEVREIKKTENQRDGRRRSAVLK